MKIKKWIIILCSLGFSGWLLSAVELDDSLNYVQQADRLFLTYYLALSCLGAITRAFRWFIVLHHQSHKVRFIDVFAGTLVRNATVDLLPARLGESSLLFVFKALKVPFKSSISALGSTFLLDIVVLCLILGVFLSGQAPLLVSIGILALGLILLIILVFSPDILRVVGRWGLEKLVPSLLFLKDKKVLSGLIGATFVLRLAKYLSLYCLAVAVIDTGLPLGQTTVAFISAEAAASLPASGVLGFGAYEAAWSGAARAAGIGVEDIVTKVFALHLITQVWGIVLGLVGYWWIAFVVINERRKQER